MAEPTTTRSHKVILTGPKDWELWYTALKATANSYNVWEICDPDGTAVPTPVPTLPEDPPEFAETVPAEPAAGAEPSVRETYKQDLEAYRQREATHKNGKDLWTQRMALYGARRANHFEQQKSLNLVRKFIQESIAAGQNFWISDEVTVRGTIRRLQEKNGSTDLARKQETRQEYLSHLRNIKKIQLNTWIDQYQLLLGRVIKLKLADVDQHADQTVPLLATIRTVHPEFAEPASFEVAQATTDNEIPTGQNMADRYRTWLRETRPEQLFGKKNGAAFVTFQGRDEAGKGRRTKCEVCLTDEHVSIFGCPYPFPGRRPEGWRGNKESYTRMNK